MNRRLRERYVMSIYTGKAICEREADSVGPADRKVLKAAAKILGRRAREESVAS